MVLDPTIMKSRFGAVRADTYERLKKEIIDGRYSPGMLVQISEFARDLGVSRTPVRQALSSLERDFLVDLMDGRGAVIRSEEHTSELQSLMRSSYAVFCLTKTIKRI